ncbi:Uncharacterised protein [Vibrio cholerae]|uniref:Uncharacterized protein n=1 Tax=Vibrio cholerae TaxID=666 RepID=A0A655Z099_VIBCL|nr:Uncharacterised protein [Vibrio cholerae]CSA91622.1 Uncharacterised protein [Vibrio cholerae]CSB97878.1 Uncharacterised protein [Vibrio cholerae]CSC54980.1 Uncharacterised protein [Vibrio cholerae]CSC90460.1 Uncharacterised protein [Vibrio cholerae]
MDFYALWRDVKSCWFCLLLPKLSESLGMPKKNHY